MSVTAVPIQPLKKGSLTKYWAAIALVLAVGGGLAYWGTNDVRQEFGDVVTTASGLRYKIIEAGEGPNPTDNDVVLVSYKGMLKDGTVFDQNPQAGFPVTGVVPGFSEGLKIMQRGGKYRLWIPADLGYGPEDQRNPQTGEVAIPGGSELTFDVELLKFKSRAEIKPRKSKCRKCSSNKATQAVRLAGRHKAYHPKFKRKLTPKCAVNKARFGQY